MNTMKISDIVGLVSDDYTTHTERLHVKKIDDDLIHRAEWIGDSFLNHTVSMVLFKQKPLAKAGQLTTARQEFVARDHLCTAFDKWGLGKWWNLKHFSIEKHGSHSVKGNVFKVKSDAVEVLIGLLVVRGHLTEAELLCGALMSIKTAYVFKEEDVVARIKEHLDSIGELDDSSFDRAHHELAHVLVSASYSMADEMKVTAFLAVCHSMKMNLPLSNRHQVVQSYFEHMGIVSTPEYFKNVRKSIPANITNWVLLAKTSVAMGTGSIDKFYKLDIEKFNYYYYAMYGSCEPKLTRSQITANIDKGDLYVN